MTDLEARKCIIHWGTQVEAFSGLVEKEGGQTYLTKSGQDQAKALHPWTMDAYFDCAAKVRRGRVKPTIKDLFDQLRAYGDSKGIVSMVLSTLGDGSVVSLPDGRKGIVDLTPEPCVWILDDTKLPKPEWTALSQRKAEAASLVRVSLDRQTALKKEWWELELRNGFAQFGPWKLYRQDSTGEPEVRHEDVTLVKPQPSIAEKLMPGLSDNRQSGGEALKIGLVFDNALTPTPSERIAQNLRTASAQTVAPRAKPRPPF